MWDQKDNQRNNSWKSPNLGERHKPIVSRIRENPKYEKKKICNGRMTHGREAERLSTSQLQVFLKLINLF